MSNAEVPKLSTQHGLSHTHHSAGEGTGTAHTATQRPFLYSQVVKSSNQDGLNNTRRITEPCPRPPESRSASESFSLQVPVENFQYSSRTTSRSSSPSFLWDESLKGSVAASSVTDDDETDQPHKRPGEDSEDVTGENPDHSSQGWSTVPSTKRSRGRILEMEIVNGLSEPRWTDQKSRVELKSPLKNRGNDSTASVYGPDPYALDTLQYSSPVDLGKYLNRRGDISNPRNLTQGSPLYAPWVKRPGCCPTDIPEDSKAMKDHIKQKHRGEAHPVFIIDMVYMPERGDWLVWACVGTSQEKPAFPRIESRPDSSPKHDYTGRGRDRSSGELVLYMRGEMNKKTRVDNTELRCYWLSSLETYWSKSNNEPGPLCPDSFQKLIDKLLKTSRNGRKILLRASSSPDR
ncbi:hypothetical protein BX600DRAFT_542046 [Xylariales sp. PMI_506]|nr:hypothetical protein BX600DRAFT_542046 [Xylariales sp. PMI_506]